MQLTGVDGNALTSGGLVPHPVAKVRIAEGTANGSTLKVL
jgi:hypothetical protein